MKKYGSLIAVSGSILSITVSCLDHRAVIKIHREDDTFGTSDVSEDSDYKNEQDRFSVPSPETQVEKEGEELESKTLPVLTIGSFTRHADHCRPEPSF